jgi:lipoprotein-anchoring transpeptidase ErfK/SrfK
MKVMKKISLPLIILLIFIIILLLSFFALSKKSTMLYKADQTTEVLIKKETLIPKEQGEALPKKNLTSYLEIVDACGPSPVGLCVNMRSGPGLNFNVINKLRTGIVLPIEETVTQDNLIWYKIKIESEIQFPERVTEDWFVASGDYVRIFNDEGTIVTKPNNKATSTKRIVIDLSEQMIYAYDGDTLFMKAPVSTGLKDTPTPRGHFTIFKKTLSRYMQGPIAGVSDQYYDLPGVPWDLYFTVDGAVIHGTYWHDHFGEPWSHGCVNLSTENAKKLYFWADVGIAVIVQN